MKYEFTGKIKKIESLVLKQIRALIDIPLHNIKKGQIGGWIEKESNLSQEGSCWITKNVYIYNNAIVHDDVYICGSSRVSEYAGVFNKVKISGCVHIRGSAMIYDNVKLSGAVSVYGNAIIYGNANISYCASVSGNACIGGNVTISGTIHISHGEHFIGDAVITSTNDYIVFNRFWDYGTHIIWTRSNNMWYDGNNFYGTAEDLVKVETHDFKHGEHCQRMVDYVNSVWNQKFKLLSDYIRPPFIKQ